MRLQAHVVTQAASMLSETPATPQTSALLFPFSVPHKRHRHSGTAKVKNNKKNQKQLQRQKQRQPQKPRLINGIHYNLSFGCIDVAVAVVFDSVFDFNPLGTM